MLLLVRNFVPAHEQIERGDWNVAEVARSSFDLEGKVIGTVGAGVSEATIEAGNETGDGQLTFKAYRPACSQAVDAVRPEGVALL